MLVSRFSQPSFGLQNTLLKSHAAPQFGSHPPSELDDALSGTSPVAASPPTLSPSEQEAVNALVERYNDEKHPCSMLPRDLLGPELERLARGGKTGDPITLSAEGFQAAQDAIRGAFVAARTQRI